MLENLVITKLFGRFDYEIDLKDGGITILTGPNGFGKSTILKIIEAASNGDLVFFRKLNFLTIILKSHKKEVCIRKEDKYFSINGVSIEPILRRYTKNGNYFLNNKVIFENKMCFLENSYENNEIFKFNTETMHNLDDSYKEISNIEAKKEILFQANKLFKLTEEMKSLCGRVRLISEQRLIQEIKSTKKKSKTYNEKKMRHVISDIPNDLKKEISKISEQYSQVSNRLDSTYPQRLFSAKKGLKSSSEFKIKLEEAFIKFKRLSKYALIDQDITIFERNAYKDEFSIAFKIYFDDFAVKYSVFEPLLTKLELFTNIINERLLFKEIRITNDGFVVVDIDNNKSLSLEDLSSGEKQEIVLFYDLIFNTDSELLLLIDEPEISLHIAWQKRFLDDLLKVAENVSLKAIVATHSPQIINNHWDIQIDLGELYGREFN
ncbi:AAA family ATPase [Acetobacterium wieringae]|uniref:Vitamin B12 import ATP-binding protein BtuD n=1 Tax=Acetobacterium wieringae TaxID=52694 RepID=A0A1F2PBW0_9FIRM|nr:AAA family ATPase [Acetobacterium wieringae]OFV68909.1 vitamin B12 import ATP-binding protein BtuD [Acetobacterium wieringae]